MVEEEGEGSKTTMETLTSGRKEKRKLLKKLKRKEVRKETASKVRAEEEARLDDPEEQTKLMLKEQEEAELILRQRKEFEERERLWIEKVAKKAQEEEETARRRKVLEEEAQTRQIENEGELNEDDAWDYVEEGPAEIIWQGNEIIVKKKRVRVAKTKSTQQPDFEDVDRPTSNPLPPQSEAISSYKNTSISAKQVFESVSNQTPNFGTEQDKANCPFHIKTGACRFGSRCSRVHFYPDKSCTLLIKNMYNGPGLAWEQDEGLEHTDEEVERSYEEFYEDVHTEFLKFGEIVNFKVCRNGSFHLRGNVYVHYKSLESAILAYLSINGRYFAGKQITCEYVGVTRWKVAICGEYMKSRLKTCSRGTACNFIHCFRNPGGDYEWADWDKPPPYYWVRRMTALFGPSDELEYEKQKDLDSRHQQRSSSKNITPSDRYSSRRSRSRDIDYVNSSCDEDNCDVNRSQRHSHSSRHEHLARTGNLRSSGDDHDSHYYSLRDRERHDRHSRGHSRYTSKWEDHLSDHENGRKTNITGDYGAKEGKDGLDTDSSSRMNSNRVQSKKHPSGTDRKTRREEFDFLGEHAHESCKNRSGNDGWSNKRGSDQCGSPYEDSGTDDHRQLKLKSHDRSSGGQPKEIRSSGSIRSSHRVHSERDSSGEDLHLEGCERHSNRKHHHRKHRSLSHKEHERKYSGTCTSVESREASDFEQEGTCETTLHHSDKRQSNRRSQKHQDSNKKRKD